MIKNFLFYAFSTFVNEFVSENGPGHMCRVFGTVTLCGFVTCVPMCKFATFYFHPTTSLDKMTRRRKAEMCEEGEKAASSLQVHRDFDIGLLKLT